MVNLFTKNSEESYEEPKTTRRIHMYTISIEERGFVRDLINREAQKANLNLVSREILWTYTNGLLEGRLASIALFCFFC